jgi:predicted Zn-dependent protease
MNPWKLLVAVLAACSLLSLNAIAQGTQAPASQGTPAPAAQSAPAPAAQDNQAATAQDPQTAKDASADTDQQTPADKKAAKKKAPKPPSPEAMKKDPDAIGNRDIGKGVNFYSLEKEIALGKSLAQEVEREAKIVDDPIVAEYVNRVGQNLVRNSDAKVPFTIKVLDTEEVNAFALPGGFFFVNSGLILKADSESELAGVMAHEIAHVAARHGTKQATRGDIAQIATIPLIFAGGWAGYAVRQGMGLAIPMGFLTFSRAFEREADYLGLQYMYKAGYDPTAFVDFFEKIQTLEKRKPGTISKVFATHPMTDDRIKASQEEIQQILAPKPEYVVNTSEFNDVKARLSMLHNRRKVTQQDDPSRPKLRRAPGSSTGPVDDNPDGTKPSTDQDERPTLKRRDGGGSDTNSSGGNGGGQ